jgi:hypothetical protein
MFSVLVAISADTELMLATVGSGGMSSVFAKLAYDVPRDILGRSLLTALGKSAVLGSLSWSWGPELNDRSAPAAVIFGMTFFVALMVEAEESRRERGRLPDVTGGKPDGGGGKSGKLLMTLLPDLRGSIIGWA